MVETFQFLLVRLRDLDRNTQILGIDSRDSLALRINRASREFTGGAGSAGGKELYSCMPCIKSDSLLRFSRGYFFIFQRFNAFGELGSWRRDSRLLYWRRRASLRQRHRSGAPGQSMSRWLTASSPVDAAVFHFGACARVLQVPRPRRSRSHSSHRTIHICEELKEQGSDFKTGCSSVGCFAILQAFFTLCSILTNSYLVVPSISHFLVYSHRFPVSIPPFFL